MTTIFIQPAPISWLQEWKMKSLPVVIGCLVCLILLPSVSALGGGEGWVEVRCNVDGASVMFDGSYKGVISGGVLTVPVYTTATPFKTATVEKAGYYSGSAPITMPAEGMTTTVYITLNPIPAPPTPTPVMYGSISVDSTPSGAEIYFNGDYRGLSPVIISDVWPGSYTITAEKSGYRSYTTTTTVSSGTRSNVYCPLSRLDTAGSLYVLSSPANANIYLDGVYKGRTPMTITDISSGMHTLEIDHPGYYDWRSSVEVPAGGTKTLSATLNPMPSASSGWIYVSSSPGGASVTLDGNSVGQTPYSGSLKLNNIATGSHNVALILAGYAPYSAQTSVYSNTVSEVTAVLTPQAPVSATGGLTVSSTPSGAQVFLDNAFIGITPLTLASVASGTHTVTIRMDGYPEYSTTTPVNAGATSTVSAALTAVTLPTPKSPVPAALVLLALCVAGFVLSRKE